MTKRIVVIGSGGAGLVAAIAAKKADTEVVVLGKTSLGTASCTAYAGAIFTLGCGKVPPEMHATQTLQTGCHINDLELVQTFSEKALKSLRELQSWGITLKLLDNGHASTLETAPNFFMAGYGMVKELYQKAEECGIIFMEDMVATSLRMQGERISGVEAVNWKTGKAHGIGASSVILATGGAGQIYERTDNPARITGDGYSLALRAGAALRDMEFVQFYPLGWNEPGFTDWMLDLSLIDMVPLVDEEGREFLLDAIRSWGLSNGMEANYYARDRSAIFMERHLRKGGKALLHLEKLPEERWRKGILSGMLNFYPKDTPPWEYGPVQVSPIEHYMTGGVIIDTECRTGIDGLYACGEVTGGVDGASRIGGNALTNIVTFGLIAGRSAHRGGHDEAADFDTLPAEKRLKNMQKGEISPETIRNSIKSSVQEGLGPVRTASSIKKTMEKLQDLESLHNRVKADSSLELLKALEIRGLLDSAMSVAAAALKRGESRGVHYREDYPDSMKEWEKPVEISFDGDEIRAK